MMLYKCVGCMLPSVRTFCILTLQKNTSMYKFSAQSYQYQGPVKDFSFYFRIYSAVLTKEKVNTI